MNINMIKMSMAILLMCICSHSRAGFIYDFVCEEPTCENLTISGSFTLAEDTVRSVGANFGDIEDFVFECLECGSVWRLDDKDEEFTIEFSADLTTITGFCRDNDFPDCLDNQADFTNDDTENSTLSVRPSGGGFGPPPFRRGEWRLNQEDPTDDPDTISVHEPSALPILTLSLLGLAARRFKKQS
jgi:hypothetical protein